MSPNGLILPKWSITHLKLPKISTIFKKWTPKGIAADFAFEIGDINQDTSIDILDIIELVNEILNGNSDGIEFYLSDLNGDDILNIQDLIALVNLILVF